MLDDLDQVRNFGNHAANRGVVGTLDHLVQPGETQAFDYQLMFYRSADGRTHPFQMQLATARR